jgi:tetratricopeptide (TPR) repeat protein
MATYKKDTKKDPAGDPVNFELADIYLKMGLRKEALAQYRILLRKYKAAGMKDKALKVIALMAKIDPGTSDREKKMTSLEHLPGLKENVAGIVRSEKSNIAKQGPRPKREETCFDLGAELTKVEAEETREYQEIELLENGYGFGEIFKNLREFGAPGSLNFNFNYHVGLACREEGFIEEAIEQLQIACKERQNPFEAAHLLGLCFKEKGVWEEARRAFETALQVEGVSRDDQLAVKCELGVILKEQGKTEEALEILRKIAAGDQRFQNTKVNKGKKPRKKSTKK